MKKLTAANRKEVVSADKTVVVKISATWCGPCNAYARILDALPEDLEIYALDLDDDAEWCRDELKITALPTTIVFKNGVETKRLPGVQSLDTVKNLFSE